MYRTASAASTAAEVTGGADGIVGGANAADDVDVTSNAVPVVKASALITPAFHVVNESPVNDATPADEFVDAVVDTVNVWAC